MKINNIEKILGQYVNPIIKTIKLFISNNQNIKPFLSLLQDNVQINGIDYQLLYSEPFNKLTNFNNIKNHISFLFNIINDTSNSKKLKYKYITNYSNHNEKTEFVINQIKLKSEPSDIIIGLKNNFNLESNIVAKDLFEEIIQTLTLLENDFNYKKFNIKNAPGFNINIDIIENILNINIFNIDNIFYINKIILYFDSIIKIITNTKTKIITDESILELFKEKIAGKNIHNTNNFIEDNIHNDANNIFVNNQLVADTEDDDIDKNIINVDNQSDQESDDDIFNLLLNDDTEDEDDIIKDNSIENIDIDRINDNDNDSDSDSFIEKDTIKPDIKIEEDNSILKEESFNIREDISPDHDKKVDDEDNEIKFGKANPILKRLLNYEKNIFGKKIEMLSGNDNQYFTNYSRLCQSKRQPVIINQEEKDKIDSENPGSYNDIIEYSSDKNNKHYYICPQFWDIKKNIPLTKEQFESGNYGKLIDKKSGNIMIFDKDIKQHIPKTPGFLKIQQQMGFVYHVVSINQ